MANRKCELCGKEFIGRKDARFCSNAHRAAATRKRIENHCWESDQCESFVVTAQKPIQIGITEDDVRRIVRDELAARADKVESVLRSVLDELFDAA
jgi:hypothetical protein